MVSMGVRIELLNFGGVFSFVDGDGGVSERRMTINVGWAQEFVGCGSAFHRSPTTAPHASHRYPQRAMPEYHGKTRMDGSATCSKVGLVSNTIMSEAADEAREKLTKAQPN
jgi:hypothetical protein